MSDETNKKAKEIRKARRMLRELSQLSEHASLTGAYKSEGAVDAIQAYNQILAFVEAQEISTHGMFSTLPSDASWSRLGVSSRLLRSFLEEEEEECAPKGVKIVVGKHGEHAGHIDLEELGKLKDIGAVIREHLPDFLRTPPTPPAPPTPPTPPTPPSPPDGRDDA